MKRTKDIMAMTLLGVSLVFSGCNDWLELDPEDAVPAENYWVSEENVAGAMTGIYCSLLNTYDRMVMQGEMRADYMQPNGTYDNSYSTIYEGNITSSNSWVAWAAYYTVINNCNLLLARADMALANDPSFATEDCESYKAQATVIRALMYFYLIRLYKDVPYVTWPYYEDVTERDCAPTAQLDILNDLIAQLESVQRDGTLRYSYSLEKVAYNKGQVTMYMLKTLLADMYRWKGALETAAGEATAAYQRCVDLCNEVIESGQFALLPVPKTDAKVAVGSYLEDAQSHADSCLFVLTNDAADYMFDQLFVRGNSVESIFELQVDDYSANPLWSAFCYNSRRRVPNKTHLDEDIFIPSTNAHARDANYEDIRTKIACGGSGDPKYCWKYAGLDLYNTTYTAQTDFKRNIVVYRLAEVYLMKAEALNQLAWANGEDPAMLLEAYKAVYKVRDRASAVEATDVTTGAGETMQIRYWDDLRNDSTIVLENGELSCKEMEQFILDEEGREMAFEGRRWFDVLRHAARNDYGKGATTGGDLNYLLNIVFNSTTIDKVTYLRNAYQNFESHYLPYPYQDVRMNSLLEQKPFYGTE